MVSVNGTVLTERGEHDAVLKLETSNLEGREEFGDGDSVGLGVGGGPGRGELGGCEVGDLILLGMGNGEEGEGRERTPEAPLFGMLEFLVSATCWGTAWWVGIFTDFDVELRGAFGRSIEKSRVWEKQNREEVLLGLLNSCGIS